MTQTKTQSLIEACINIAIGFVINLCAQFVIFPMFDINISFSDHLGITGMFTIVAIIRMYLLRRYFNSKLNLKRSKL